MKYLNLILIAALFGAMSAPISAADPQKEQLSGNKATGDDAFCKTLRESRPNAVCGTNYGKTSQQKFNDVLRQARPHRPAAKASAASQPGMAN